MSLRHDVRSSPPAARITSAGAVPLPRDRQLADVGRDRSRARRGSRPSDRCRPARPARPCAVSAGKRDTNVQRSGGGGADDSGPVVGARAHRLDQAARRDDLAAARFDRGARVGLGREARARQPHPDLVGLQHLDRKIFGGPSDTTSPLRSTTDSGAALLAPRQRARQRLGREEVRRARRVWRSRRGSRRRTADRRPGSAAPRTRRPRRSAAGSGFSRRWTNSRSPVPRTRNSCENVHDPLVSSSSALSRSGVPRRAPRDSRCRRRRGRGANVTRATPASIGCRDDSAYLMSPRLWNTRKNASSAPAAATIGWRARDRGMCANSSTRRPPGGGLARLLAPGRGPACSVMLGRERASGASRQSRLAPDALAITRAFRYVRGMSGRLYRLSMLAACSAVAAPAAGAYKAKTPAEAYKRFSDAVEGAGTAARCSIRWTRRRAGTGCRSRSSTARRTTSCSAISRRGPSASVRPNVSSRRRPRPARASCSRTTRRPTLLPMFLPLTMAEGAHRERPGRRSRGGHVPDGRARRAHARQERRLGFRGAGERRPKRRRTARTTTWRSCARAPPTTNARPRAPENDPAQAGRKAGRGAGRATVAGGAVRAATSRPGAAARDAGARAGARPPPAADVPSSRASTAWPSCCARRG